MQNRENKECVQCIHADMPGATRAGGGGAKQGTKVRQAAKNTSEIPHCVMQLNLLPLATCDDEF